MIGFRFWCIIAYLPIFACDIYMYAIDEVPDFQESHCPRYEKYVDCTSGPCSSCEYAYKPCALKPYCEPGCDCIEGFFRDEYGYCIPREACQASEIYCKEREQYYNCIPNCTNTCESYGIIAQIQCPAICIPGCFCAEGLVKHKDGECIPYESCPDDVCPKNEEPKNFINPCNTCQERGLCLEDSPGCDCKKGYFRDNEGNCIPECECDHITLCPANEEYSECAVPCNDCMIKGNCQFLVCNPGCDCISGFYRNQEGICVEENQCETQNCPKNEEIVNCVKPRWCNTCEIKGDCKLQAESCKTGCDCKENYYRDERGICIPAEYCPNIPKHCEEDEEYNECGTACPRTCENLKGDYACTLQCVPACFCKRNLVRSDSGKCILPIKCPPNSCPQNEIPSSCVPRCETCDNPGIDCEMFACNIGCQCREGYLRNSEGTCIPAKSCPKQCKSLERYYECKPSCRITCDTYLKEIFCPYRKCEPGCECIEGLVRDADGDCINPKNCESICNCPLEPASMVE